MKRRDLLKLSLAGTAYSLVPGFSLVGCTKNILEPIDRELSTDFCSPVDLDENMGGFYVEFVRGKTYKPTDLTLDTWQLTIWQENNSVISRSISPNFDEVMSAINATRNMYPGQERTFFNTFQCVGNNPGGNLISNGYFTGIPLKLLLKNLGFDLTQPEIRRLYFRCFDGYYTNHRIQRVLADDPSPIYFVYRFDGIPLSENRDGSLKHGFPFRLVTQDMMGMKSPKSLTEIVISDRDEVDGWWETRPTSSAEPDILWADIPPLRINSKINEPSDFQAIKSGTTFTVKGIALSGAEPVQSVALGIERKGDPSTKVLHDVKFADRPTEMSRPIYDDSISNDYLNAVSDLNALPWPAPFVWINWQFDWQVPAESGAYILSVQAMDTAGATQPVRESRLEGSDGKNAIHSLEVTVES